MKDSPHLAMHATGVDLSDGREIGAFKISVVAIAPTTQDAQRRRVDAMVRWLVTSFTPEEKVRGATPSTSIVEEGSVHGD
jgi:hypothetical protein